MLNTNFKDRPNPNPTLSSQLLYEDSDDYVIEQMEKEKKLLKIRTGILISMTVTFFLLSISSFILFYFKGDITLLEYGIVSLLAGCGFIIITILMFKSKYISLDSELHFRIYYDHIEFPFTRPYNVVQFNEIIDIEIKENNNYYYEERFFILYLKNNRKVIVSNRTSDLISSHRALTYKPLNFNLVETVITSNSLLNNKM